MDSKYIKKINNKLIKYIFNCQMLQKNSWIGILCWEKIDKVAWKLGNEWLHLFKDVKNVSL